MTQHDTPEAVEAMAAWHGEGKAWPAGVPMPQMHADQATAAMLRRLHKRAVDAEQERERMLRAMDEMTQYAKKREAAAAMAMRDACADVAREYTSLSPLHNHGPAGASRIEKAEMTQAREEGRKEGATLYTDEELKALRLQLIAGNEKAKDATIAAGATIHPRVAAILALIPQEPRHD